MDAEMAALSSRYAVAEMLLSGITTVLDMYYFEEVVAKVMDEMGIRGIAGETVMETDSCDSENTDQAIERGLALIAAYKDHPRVSGTLTPHGTTTCSPETLKRVYEEDVKSGKRVHTPHGGDGLRDDADQGTVRHDAGRVPGAHRGSRPEYG